LNIFQIKKINNAQTINSNRFSIEFKGLGSKLIRAENSTLFGVAQRYEAVKNAIGDNPEISLELSLFSASLPAVMIEHQFIGRFNDGVKAVTKFAEMEDMTITFWDYVNGSASAIMQLWHSMVGDKRTGAIGFKQDFVLPRAFFVVYGPDAPGYSDEFVAQNGVPWLQKYEVVNLFPKSVNLGEHSADTAEARKIECTFAVDNIYPIGIRTYDYNAATAIERYSDVPQTAL